ncbi:N-methyl-L-tryptophan oxidase [Mariniblastus sp.]|nr:N-methyl-L-tryptophan oxidase [Mariniblastus sp.]
MPDQSTVYDCIVVGYGGVGSASLMAAAKKGWNVLGIDRFGPAHDRGSSHGQTRIIRRAYFEHPNYVPLANRAFEMWDDLNKRHRTSPDKKELLTQTGLLQMGRKDSELIQGVVASAQAHDLKIEHFTPDEIRQRLPLFKIPDHFVGVFEPGAAFLRVELCVAAMIQQAVKSGAELKSNHCVEQWDVDEQGLVTVKTDRGIYRARRLVIAAGGWSEPLLGDLDLGLQLLHKQQQWFQLDRVDQKLESQFPCFLLEEDNGDCFYGFPEIDYLGMKVCEHTGGVPVNCPANVDRGLDEAQLMRTRQFMRDHCNYGKSRLVHHSACVYTMSPDGHFFVDRYPGFSNVVFAAGLSGHGFKFAPVLGSYLVDLLEGNQTSEFDFLKIGDRASKGG